MSWSGDRPTRKPPKTMKVSLEKFLQIAPAHHPLLVPFLPPQAGFHPKRNQARIKLATLQPPRFQDLTSDLRYELGRRYPECKEEVTSLPFGFVKV